MAKPTKALLLKAAEQLDCERKKSCLHCQLIDAAEKLGDPTVDGLYLLLCYEWVGVDKDRPRRPHWQIRMYREGHWAKRVYGFDTGGYENFVIVRWQQLPPVE